MFDILNVYFFLYSVILIAGHRYVPGRVTSSKVKERKYTVKTSSGKTYSNRDAANIILDGLYS